MTKKTSIIVIISIIIIVISLIISIYLPNKDKIKEEKEDESVSYYLYKEGESFGVINQNGEIVIEPQFEEVIIPNPHKAVFICNSETEQKVLNNNKEEILTQYKNIKVIELANIISETMYEKRVLIYEENGKYGVINLNGEIVVEAKYEEISSLGYKEGEILVKENGKYGIIDDKGNQKIKNKFDLILSDEFYSLKDGYGKSGYIVRNTTSDGYRYGYYDYEGSEVLEVEYNEISRVNEIENSDEIYLVASKNGQYGVFVNNSKIINTQYQSIVYNESIQMFIVERTGKYGAINSKGVEILNTSYSEIQVNGIYLYTKKDEEQKVYNNEGKEVNIPFTTTIVSTTNPEYYIITEEDEYSILNSHFEKISKNKYKYIEYVFDKFFIATNNEDRTGVIDVDENIVLDFKYDLIQCIKEKNIVQAINFKENSSTIYNNEIKEILQIKNINIENLNDYVKIFNESEEYYLDNNGNKIEDENRLKQIHESNAMLKIGDFKRVTYDFGHYYYIKEN